MLGLPDHITAGLFDLDVLLKRRETIHQSEWAGTLDDYMWVRAARSGRPYVPLAAYPPELSGGDDARAGAHAEDAGAPGAEAADEPGAAMVAGAGPPTEQRLAQSSAQPEVGHHPGSASYLRSAAGSGLRRAAVSENADCRELLAGAGFDAAFDVYVDRLVVIEERLRSKPYPDLFLAAARRLGMAPQQCAVFGASTAAMMAGHDGGFGFVVGVDRVGQAAGLRANGAHLVVEDLAELLALA